MFTKANKFFSSYSVGQYLARIATVEEGPHTIVLPIVWSTRHVLKTGICLSEEEGHQ